MQASKIRELIKLPEVHKRILGAYKGPYSLAVGLSPHKRGEYVILLFVEGEEPEGFPDEITVGGDKVPVVVQDSFTAPRALTERKHVRQKSNRRDAA